MAEVVIFGASMAAEVARTYLEAHTEHRIVGFTVDAAYMTSDRFCDLPVVPWDEIDRVFPPDRVELLGPVSYQRMNQIRRDRFLEGKARGYRYTSFVHPDCRVYADEIGEHCFILGQTVIEPRARIGSNVIIWGGCYIAHHCVIGDHTFLSGQVGVAGGTHIGECCFLGGKVGVAERLVIGDRCLLSFGTNVTTNLPPGSVVVRGRKDRIARLPSSRMQRVL